MSLFMIYVVYVCLCKGHAPHQVLKFAEHVSLLPLSKSVQVHLKYSPPANL